MVAEELVVEGTPGLFRATPRVFVRSSRRLADQRSRPKENALRVEFQNSFPHDPRRGTQHSSVIAHEERQNPPCPAAAAIERKQVSLGLEFTY